ncbi:MAG: UrcA family protein [Sphingomonas sp.]|nr:UrcA family protein [Sphingomonas sp.]
MRTQGSQISAAVLSGVAASLFIASSASAMEPVVVYGAPAETRTVEVRFDDLDLAQYRHEQRLNRRVAAAVRKVCDDGDGPGIRRQDYLRCADGAWDDAAPQIAAAVERARQLASTGRTTLAANAITIKSER